MTLGTRIKAARVRAKLTQADIARQFGIKASSVSQWETDETVPELDRLSRLAAILGVTVEYLTTEGAALPAERGHTVDAADLIPNARQVRQGNRDLPIRGTAQGGPDGIVTLSEDPIDYTWRPPELMQVKDAFALWVDGDSMTGFGLPEGAEVHVNPHRGPKTQGFCVLVKRGGDAFVKRYVGRKSGKWLLEQSNPPKVLEFLESEVRAVYRVTSVTYP